MHAPFSFCWPLSAVPWVLRAAASHPAFFCFQRPPRYLEYTGSCQCSEAKKKTFFQAATQKAGTLDTHANSSSPGRSQKLGVFFQFCAEPLVGMMASNCVLVQTLTQFSAAPSLAPFLSHFNSDKTEASHPGLPMKGHMLDVCFSRFFPSPGRSQWLRIFSSCTGLSQGQGLW